MITNAEILESKRLTSNSIEFHKIIYTGQQGMFKLIFEQYYWVIKGEAFVLTLTCEEKEFETHKVIGEKILNSFQINNN